jgi:hypothetical protein
MPPIIPLIYGVFLIYGVKWAAIYLGYESPQDFAGG